MAMCVNIDDTDFSGFRDVAESLCDKLIGFEAALSDDKLQQLLKKSEQPEDPYKSTKGWSSNKRRNNRIEAGQDFIFGKPSDRLTLVDSEFGVEEDSAELDTSDADVLIDEISSPVGGSGNSAVLENQKLFTKEDYDDVALD